MTRTAVSNFAALASDQDIGVSSGSPEGRRRSGRSFSAG
jgi:hypothetical protein